MKQSARIATKFFAWVFLIGLTASFVLAQETDVKPRWPEAALQPSAGFPEIQIAPGYQIEKVVDGLTYPTSVTWDDQGRMYVAEAGGAFLEEEPPARILRIEDGRAIEVANLNDKGVRASVVGLTWHDGAFYFTHRADDRTGAVSRMTMDGQVELLFKGFIDSQTDHQLNEIRVGPDGRMYFASGAGGNSAIMGQDMTPFLLKSPEAHTTVCQDVVLTGRNFWEPNFLTKEPGDFVLTGAFVPFGTETVPGQTIPGRVKCGGAILSFDPNSPNPEQTLEVYAWGFRNVIGMAWNDRGEMFATQNGYDVVPSRPVEDKYDPTYRVRKGEWYGWPDFSAALEPLTLPEFEAPNSLHSPVYVLGELQPRSLEFLIDHEASGLDAPDKSLVLGLHPLNSSPSKPDMAPASWGEFAGDLFVPEWGDLTWFTNAKRSQPVGYGVVRIDPETGEMHPFVQNVWEGPASKAPNPKALPYPGIERPFDVKFGPDGAMYIVDYGVAWIVLRRIAEGNLPYEFPPETGVIWKVTRTGGTAGNAAAGGGTTSARAQAAMQNLQDVLEQGIATQATPEVVEVFRNVRTNLQDDATLQVVAAAIEPVEAAFMADPFDQAALVEALQALALAMRTAADPGDAGLMVELASLVDQTAAFIQNEGFTPRMEVETP